MTIKTIAMYSVHACMLGAGDLSWWISGQQLIFLLMARFCHGEEERIAGWLGLAMWILRSLALAISRLATCQPTEVHTREGSLRVAKRNEPSQDATAVRGSANSRVFFWVGDRDVCIAYG